MPPTFGIIGLGAFGRLVHDRLAATGEVFGFDPSVAGADSTDALERASQAEAVIFAVSVQRLQSVLAIFAPRLRPGTIVADVCSVKIRPCQMMLEQLPGDCEIIGTHPLFGPQTVAEKGLAGCTIALCPVRCTERTMQAARGLLAGDLGLSIVETSADDHDRQMASVQALTHLIGHAAASLDLPETDLATLAYRRLLRIRENVIGDSPELFDAIQTWNPYAAGARERMLDAMHGVHDRTRRPGADG